MAQCRHSPHSRFKALVVQFSVLCPQSLRALLCPPRRCPSDRSLVFNLTCCCGDSACFTRFIPLYGFYGAFVYKLAYHTYCSSSSFSSTSSSWQRRPFSVGQSPLEGTASIDKYHRLPLVSQTWGTSTLIQQQSTKPTKTNQDKTRFCQ